MGFYRGGVENVPPTGVDSSEGLMDESIFQSTTEQRVSRTAKKSQEIEL